MDEEFVFIKRGMIPLAGKISNNRYLLAIRDAFFVLMPFILTASFFGIFEWVVFDPWGPILGENGLDLGNFLTGGLRGEAYEQAPLVRGLIVLQQICSTVVTVGFGMRSFLLTTAFAYRLSRIWHSDPVATAFVAMGAFIIVTPQQFGGQAGFGLDYFGSKGVLTALLVAWTSAWLFQRLRRIRRLSIRMPDSVPEEIAKYFAMLLPVVLIFSVFAIFAGLLANLQFMGKTDLHDLLYALIQAPLMNFSQGLGFALLYQFVIWFLWWFGIHGQNVTAAVQNMVYMPAQLANQAGEASYVFSNGFFEAGLMHILGLIIALLVFSKNASWRSVAKFSLPAMLFNIQEPIVFGLPIMLNPLFLIPYVLAPLANTVVGWVAISWGIVPIFKFVVPWATPMIFSGTIGTGSLMGGVLQVIWLVLDIFIYAPFVIASNELQSDDKEGVVDHHGG